MPAARISRGAGPARHGAVVRRPGTVVGPHQPGLGGELVAGGDPLAVAAQPDPGLLARDRQRAEARQPDPAVPDRDVQVDGLARTDGRGGDQAREVTEVGGGSLVQVDQGVVHPAAQVGQAEQPGGSPGYRVLDPRETLVPGAERGRPRLGADRGRGDRVQQHQVLAALCLAQPPHGCRAATAFGQLDK